jgi:hypothetical protein
MSKWTARVGAAALAGLLPFLAVGQGTAPKEGGDPLADIFGKDMTLNAKGTMVMELDSETGKPKMIVIDKAVDIQSEAMNLECARLEIDLEKQLMVATGEVVKFKREDLAGKCSRLTFNIETKQTVLTGPPKPLIEQSAKEGGGVTVIRAQKITITQNGKKNNVVFEGDPEITSRNEETRSEAKPEDGPKAATKIDASDAESVGKIKTRAPSTSNGR